MVIKNLRSDTANGGKMKGVGIQKAFLFRFVFILFLGYYGDELAARAAPLALLVNGGRNPTDNYCSFENDLTHGKSVTLGWDHLVFSADGSSGTAVNSVACDKQGSDRWDSGHRLILERRTIAGAHPNSATFGHIEQALIERLARTPPDDPVLLYFTDHGGNPRSMDAPSQEHFIWLWGQKMTVSQLRSLLAKIPASHKVVLVHDHCFGGGMLGAIWGNDGQPRPRTCGFSPGTGAEIVYNGESFMDMAFALSKSKDQGVKAAVDVNHDGQHSFGEVFRHMVRSNFTDSTPVSSSQLFLERYLEGSSYKKRIGARNELLSHCIFTDEGMSHFGQLMGGTHQILLHNWVSSLKSDLADQYSGAKISPNSSYAAIASSMRQCESLIEKDTADYIDANKALARAKVAWVRSKMGESTYHAYKTLKDELAAVTSKLDHATPQERGLLEAKRRELLALYSPLDSKAHRLAGATSLNLDNADFKAFVKSSSEAWPADIIPRVKKIQASLRSRNLEAKSLRRLFQSLRAANALREMADSNDINAIRQYLDMLECEDTSMGVAPKT